MPQVHIQEPGAIVIGLARVSQQSAVEAYGFVIQIAYSCLSGITD
jgi:hypothetical protein